MQRLENSPKVLIVSNRTTTGPLWAYSLQQHVNVVLEADPRNALHQCEHENPDLIILDVNLSDTDMLELVRNLRAEIVSPIILLLPARSEDYILDVYQAGADDCILKPASPSLFQAKVQVWLRRSWSNSTGTLDPLRVGGMQLFPAERMLILANGQPVHLTNLELRLLYYMMGRPGRTVTVEELNQRVWGYTAEADNTMLKNLVYRLRRKVEANPANPLIVQTVAGTGYKLAAE